jgi:hypothetical protein
MQIQIVTHLAVGAVTHLQILLLIQLLFLQEIPIGHITIRSCQEQMAAAMELAQQSKDTTLLPQTLLFFQ